MFIENYFDKKQSKEVNKNNDAGKNALKFLSPQFKKYIEAEENI